MFWALIILLGIAQYDGVSGFQSITIPMTDQDTCEQAVDIAASDDVQAFCAMSTKDDITTDDDDDNQDDPSSGS